MEREFTRDIAGQRTAPVARHGERGVATVASPALLVSPWRSRLDPLRPCTLRVHERYRAPPGRVFGAWLDPAIARQWLFATASQPMALAAIDARPGGSFRFIDRPGESAIEYTGRYAEIVPDRRLVFTLRTSRRPVESRVIVSVAPQGTGCALALIHENLPGDEARDLEDRWTGILYGLGVTLDAMPRRSTTIRSRR